MTRHTSFGLGGPADLFLRPSGPDMFEDCSKLLFESEIPVLVLGQGTNLLVRDGGIDGAVIATDAAFFELTVRGNSVLAGSGVSLSRLLIYSAEKGLSGLEGLMGIPGSAGGALIANAGSFGTAFGDRVEKARLFHPKEGLSYVGREELSLGYRESRLPPGVVIEHILISLEPGERDAILSRQRELVEKKWSTQPAGMRSAGCVFKNPPGDYAGRLIEAAGLKGARVGGAVVSDIHANFILNDRGATATDVEELVERIRERVREETGVTLDVEIGIVGRKEA